MPMRLDFFDAFYRTQNFIRTAQNYSAIQL